MDAEGVEQCPPCPLNPLNGADLNSITELCAVRDVMALSNTGPADWPTKARELIKASCFTPLRELGEAALAIRPDDPDVALAQKCLEMSETNQCVHYQ